MLQAAILPERTHRHREAVVAQHDGLEVERQVAQLADRRARPVQRLVEDLAGLLVLAAFDEVGDGVEHQRDAGERLHGPVVQEERDAATLVLLRGEDLLGDLAPCGVVHDH